MCPQFMAVGFREHHKLIFQGDGEYTSICNCRSRPYRGRCRRFPSHFAGLGIECVNARESRGNKNAAVVISNAAAEIAVVLILRLEHSLPKPSAAGKIEGTDPRLTIDGVYVIGRNHRTAENLVLIVLAGPEVDRPAARQRFTERGMTDHVTRQSAGLRPVDILNGVRQVW